MADWTDSVGWPGGLPFKFYTPVREAFLETHKRHCPYKADAKRWADAVENMRCLVKPDSQWAECLDFLVDEVQRLATEGEKKEAR